MFSQGGWDIYTGMTLKVVYNFDLWFKERTFAQRLLNTVMEGPLYGGCMNSCAMNSNTVPFSSK